MKKSLVAVLLASVVLFAPLLSFAKTGVGVGSGKIIVDQELRPGMSYTLPLLPVINTGDVVSDYEVTIEYLNGIPELLPPKEWFSFEPKLFTLEPGKVENVVVTINLPLKAEPGKYFAFLEGHIQKKVSSTGGSTMGVAAASKLYFTVVPANVFAAIYYKIAHFITANSPWTYIAFGVVIFALMVATFKKYVHLNIGISVKK